MSLLKWISRAPAPPCVTNMPEGRPCGEPSVRIEDVAGPVCAEHEGLVDGLLGVMNLCDAITRALGGTS